MCPVYMRKGSYTAKSEIFSLGVIMAELITGRLQGSQNVDLTLPRVLRETPADARAGEWPDEAVKQLKAVVGRCLNSDPEERPADMATVVRELRALLDALIPGADADAVVTFLWSPRRWRWRRRNPPSCPTGRSARRALRIWPWSCLWHRPAPG